MFKCQNEFCGKQVPPRQPVNRIVTERRNVTYEKEVVTRQRGRRKQVDIEDIPGWEIVKEISVCPQCFTKLTGKQPKLVAPQQKPQFQKARGFNTRPPRKKKWQNPKGPGSQKSSSPGTAKDRPSSSSTKSAPVVEKVNPIQVVKE